MENHGDSTDELIRRAIGDGSNLANAGKRLNLDDPYTPDDMQLANKMLKEAGFLPSWLEDSKELDANREALLRKLEIKLKSGDVPAALEADITAFNKRVLSFNLKAPQGITHKRTIDIRRERLRVLGV